jgi:peptidoglycan L-alanyl-D-glutamate endopeptidase CwlK
MLADAHPDISYWFHEIRFMFPTVHVSCVYRNKADQEKAVEEKRSILKWPNSLHNKKPSLAMDLFSLDENGKASFRVGYYIQIANFLEDRGAPIDWGGSWKNFKDPPHFQLKSKINVKG